MKKTYQIKGMHCRSCEVLIEDSVSKILGVKKVVANLKRKEMTIFGQDFNDAEVADAVRGAGYEIGSDNLSIVDFNKSNLRDILWGLLFVGVLILLAKLLSFDRWLIQAPTASNLAAVFTIGLTAGLSTCMALIGGLVLGVSARYAENHPTATVAQKFRPHLSFNFGRIIFFAVMGAVLGLFGSSFKLNGSIIGSLTIFAAVLMFVIGVQLLEIFPKFNAGLTLPKFLAKKIKFNENKSQEFSHKKAMFLGAVTFFLPCGFTQAMQVYAISTGNALQGAAIMGVFALGTAPGLIGIGGLVANIKRNRFYNIFFKGVAILVLVLAFYNLKNGIELTGVKALIPESIESVQESKNTTTTTAGELRVFQAVYEPSNYAQTIKPNQFQAKVGDVVRIEILAKEDGSGCMGSVMIPGIVNTPQFFVKDEVVKLEFTAQKAGKFQLTCAMGVQSGTLIINK